MQSALVSNTTVIFETVTQNVAIDLTHGMVGVEETITYDNHADGVSLTMKVIEDFNNVSYE